MEEAALDQGEVRARERQPPQEREAKRARDACTVDPDLAASVTDERAYTGEGVGMPAAEDALPGGRVELLQALPDDPRGRRGAAVELAGAATAAEGGSGAVTRAKRRQQGNDVVGPGGPDDGSQPLAAGALPPTATGRCGALELRG